MGFPAERLEGVYRNNIDDVVRLEEGGTIRPIGQADLQTSINKMKRSKAACIPGVLVHATLK